MARNYINILYLRLKARLKRNKTTENFHDKELHNLYSSLSMG
jgi:hypothetical protein